MHWKLRTLTRRKLPNKRDGHKRRVHLLQYRVWTRSIKCLTFSRLNDALKLRTLTTASFRVEKATVRQVPDVSVRDIWSFANHGAPDFDPDNSSLAWATYYSTSLRKTQSRSPPHYGSTMESLKDVLSWVAAHRYEIFPLKVRALAAKKILC